MSDYNYLQASNGSGDVPLIHLTAARAPGATVFAVDTVTNVPTNFLATCGTLLPSGFLDTTTKTDFKGHVSGATLVIDSFEPGTTDAGNTSTQVIVIKPTTGWANRVAQFLMNMTNKGTPEAVTTAALTTSGLLTAQNGITVTGPVTVPLHSINTTAIDFASITTDMDNMPTKSMGSVGLGYGSAAALHRVGSMVYIEINSVFAGMPGADGVSLAETIPLGYRPASGSSGKLIGYASAGANAGGCIAWDISSNGSITYNTTNGTSSGNTRVIGSAFWFTDNAWPA